MTKRRLNKREFEKVNARRIALIQKEHSGFTSEESARRFDEHPGWEAECERRYRANLTDAERAELKRLTAATDAYMNEHFPMPKITLPARLHAKLPPHLKKDIGIREEQ